MGVANKHLPRVDSQLREKRLVHVACSSTGERGGARWGAGLRGGLGDAGTCSAGCADHSQLARRLRARGAPPLSGSRKLCSCTALAACCLPSASPYAMMVTSSRPELKLDSSLQVRQPERAAGWRAALAQPRSSLTTRSYRLSHPPPASAAPAARLRAPPHPATHLFMAPVSAMTQVGKASLSTVACRISASMAGIL